MDQFNHLKTFQVTGTTDEPQVIEVSVQSSSEGPRKFALREKRDPKTDNALYKAAIKETGVGPVQPLWIDWVEWEGPFNSPTTRSPLQEILAKHAVNSEREQATASKNLENARHLDRIRAASVSRCVARSRIH